MNENVVSFTKHAIKRAHERRLWRYVNKKLFFYEAVHLNLTQAQLENVIYSYKWEKNKIKILTIYSI